MADYDLSAESFRDGCRESFGTLKIDEQAEHRLSVISIAASRKRDIANKARLA